MLPERRRHDCVVPTWSAIPRACASSSWQSSTT